jgi:hypothetical protein
VIRAALCESTVGVRSTRTPVRIAGFARGSRDYNQKIRNVAIKHESLGAVELEAIAGASRGRRGFFRVMLCEFVDRQRSDQIAGDDSRQVSFFLLVGTRASDGCRSKNRGREKGGGRQRAAQFLRHDAGLDVSESQPAVVLRDENSRPAHLDEVFPQRAGESVNVALVAQRTQMRDRRILCQKAARIVAQHRLFVVEN